MTPTSKQAGDDGLLAHQATLKTQGHEVDNRLYPIYGIIVGGDYDNDGNYYYAELTPAGQPWYRQFLPNVRRWWYEVHEIERVITDELGIGRVTHAYTPGGSDGAYTLSGAIRKAVRAAAAIADRADDNVSDMVATDQEDTDD